MPAPGPALSHAARGEEGTKGGRSVGLGWAPATAQKSLSREIQRRDLIHDISDFPLVCLWLFAGNLRDSEHETGPQRSDSNKPKCSTERVSHTPLPWISWKTLTRSPFWECCGERRCSGVWDVGSPSCGAGGAPKEPCRARDPPQSRQLSLLLFIQTQPGLPPPSLPLSQLLELLENSQQQPRTRQSSEVKNIITKNVLWVEEHQL